MIHNILLQPGWEFANAVFACCVLLFVVTQQVGMQRFAKSEQVVRTICLNIQVHKLTCYPNLSCILRCIEWRECEHSIQQANDHRASAHTTNTVIHTIEVDGKACTIFWFHYRQFEHVDLDCCFSSLNVSKQTSQRKASLMNRDSTPQTETQWPSSWAWLANAW